MIVEDTHVESITDTNAGLATDFVLSSLFSSISMITIGIAYIREKTTLGRRINDAQVANYYILVHLN